VKLNPELPWQKLHSQEDSFYQEIELKFEEKTNKMLHLGHVFVWC